MKDPFAPSTFFRMNHRTVICQKSVVAKSGNHVGQSQDHFFSPKALIMQFEGSINSTESATFTETLYVAYDKNRYANNFGSERFGHQQQNTKT